MPNAFPQIPYGWADFEALRVERCLYVDKTRFLHYLEDERYAFLIRPRRFGKSCWVSLLENYYDRNRAARFETLFAGTAVGRQPTPNRHRYVILRFDFSVIDDTPETLREHFEYYCFQQLRHALERNPDLFPAAAVRRILAAPAIHAQLNELFLHAGDHRIPLYVLIDEYDNFANTMGEWYAGYRFAKDARNELYHTDMVLYYLKTSIAGGGPPDNLIDRNVRIDYGKLRHLVTINRRLNGNFDLLRQLIGAGWVDSELQDGFPLERLAERENFLSLLHYFGLLSIRAVRDDLPRLAIPNQTVRRLLYRLTERL